MVIESQQHKYLIGSLMRWILFGVVIVVLPPVTATLYNIIVGFEVDYMDCLPDMLLAVVSVSCNLISTCLDTEKKINYLARWIIGASLVIIVFFCWGLYFLLKSGIFDIVDEILRNLYIIGGVIILFCMIYGFKVEWNTNKEGENNEK